MTVGVLRGVVFDLDGVLIDSAPVIRACLDRALVLEAMAPLSDAETPAIVGPPLLDGVTNLLRQRGDSVEAAPRIVATFRCDYAIRAVAETRLVSGITAALDELIDCGLQLAVATSKPASTAQAIIEARGLTDRFLAVEGPADSTATEPKAVTLRRALRAFDRTVPSEIAMVGDRRHDAEAALELGCLPVGVLWGYGDRTELDSAGCSVVVDRPEDLVQALCRSTRPS